MDSRQNGSQWRPPPGLAQNDLLEDRLRNMILSNASPNEGQVSAQNDSQGRSQHPASFVEAKPTRAALDELYLQPGQAHQQAPQADGQPDQAPPSPKASRKRPNQAQRRQMNAQLSIPVDTRPVDPRPVRQPGHDNQHTVMHQRGQRDDFRHQNVGFNQTASHSWSQGPQEQGRGRPQRWGGGQRGHSQGAHHWGRGQPSQQGSYHGYHNAAPNRGGRGSHGQLYNPHGNQHQQMQPEDIAAQAAFLDDICGTLIAGAEIEREDIAEKESFRLQAEAISRQVIHEFEVRQHGRQDFPPESVVLQCFGSLASGFATKAADMDLGLISPLSDPQPDAGNSEIPRLIEKAFLDHGFGARLLTRTRVPIIKVCQKPSESLMQDLLAARHKWEHGIVDQPEDADQEEHGDTAASPEDHVDAPAEPDMNSPNVPSTSQQSQPVKFFLRQSHNQSLTAYHGSAKRLLRNLHGRDIAMSNYRDFTHEDWEILNGVCQAFVQGLHDPELKRRLLSYRSLSSTPVNGDAWRSLHGVFTQMEGESMVMLWEKRTVQEKYPGKEPAAETAVSHWKSLQDQPDYDLDPVMFSKQLQIHVDRLKKLASIQLLTLEQTQFETATEYHQRTMRIMSNLRPSQSVSMEEFEKTITGHYVAGIHSHKIKAQLEDFVQTVPEQHLVRIAALALRHKSLQLAAEYEKALEKNLYDSSLEPTIRAYMEVLQGPLVKLENGLDYIIPKPDERLLEVIEGLPNPSKMAPNQPRDRYRDQLEFPKSGVGVQSDLNFSAHLALQNTTLLRCYSHTDPRVRPLILFVKHWAKMRGINTPYRGSLSSYGYVLMVLHYLVNVAQPFVCPNLQALGPPPPVVVDSTGRLVIPPNADGSPANPPLDETIACRGRFVGFWRDEGAIRHLASVNQLNGNRDSVGHLLRGFFEYYAQNGAMSTYRGVRGFDWGRDVLSLRTPGGLVSKQAKGWTGAKTVLEYQPNKNASASPTDPADPASGGQALQSPAETVLSPVSQNAPSSANTETGKPPPGTEVKEVRHRYLFAIEDPFELDHNVARTVTHNGIVSVRDEFRRAWRIIKTVDASGQGRAMHEQLLEDVNAVQAEDSADSFRNLLVELHGLRTKA